MVAHGEYCVTYKAVELWCYKPEINVTLHINYTSFKEGSKLEEC